MACFSAGRPSTRVYLVSPGLDGLDPGGLHAVRRVEIRLARAEADHVLACGLEVGRHGRDRHRRRGFDAREAACEMDHGNPRIEKRRHPTRRGCGLQAARPREVVGKARAKLAAQTGPRSACHRLMNDASPAASAAATASVCERGAPQRPQSRGHGQPHGRDLPRDDQHRAAQRALGRHRHRAGFLLRHHHLGPRGAGDRRGHADPRLRHEHPDHHHEREAPRLPRGRRLSSTTTPTAATATPPTTPSSCRCSTRASTSSRWA